jgi:hypothetical protein
MLLSIPKFFNDCIRVMRRTKRVASQLHESQHAIYNNKLTTNINITLLPTNQLNTQNTHSLPSHQEDPYSMDPSLQGVWSQGTHLALSKRPEQELIRLAQHWEAFCDNFSWQDFSSLGRQLQVSMSNDFF